MKKQLIFLMLISLFMVSPSYAQNNEGAEDDNASVAENSMDKPTAIGIWLDPKSDNKAKKTAQGILTGNEVNDLNAIKDNIKTINKFGFSDFSETTNVIDSLKKELLTFSEASNRIKKIQENISETTTTLKNIKTYKDEANKIIDELKNNRLSSSQALETMKGIKQKEDNEKQKNATQKSQTTQKGEVKDGDKTTPTTPVAGEKPTEEKVTDPNVKIRALEGIIKLKNDTIKDLNAKLTKIYTNIFTKSWGDFTPFSKFDKDLFNRDYKEIKDNLSVIPDEIQKIHDDYLVYQKGYKCLNSPYNADSIKSIKEAVLQLYDETPENNIKKADLEKLNGQLYDYKNTVIIFQEQVINVVKDKKRPSVQKPEEWIKGIFQPILPAYLKAIDDIPWLKTQLEKYKDYMKNNNTREKNKLEGEIKEIYNKILEQEELEDQELEQDQESLQQDQDPSKQPEIEFSQPF